MLSHTSTDWAPWHVIPADRKWFARLGAGAVLVHALMELGPRYPAVNRRQREVLAEVKEALEAQARKGVAPDPFEQEQREARAGEAARRDGKAPAAEATAAAKAGARRGG